MWTIRSIVLSLVFVITSFTVSAQRKKDAMLLPIDFVNFKDIAIQESLRNYTQTELDNFFDLKSDEEVKEAMVAATLEVDSETCTAEECRKLMGRMLDVDYTFNLKIINTGQDWDLFVIRTNNFDERTRHKHEDCKDCSLSKARKLISEMFSSMRGRELSSSGDKSSLSVDSNPKSVVFIDGIRIGETPLERSVDANKSFEIFLVAEGYNDFSDELNLRPGQKKEIYKKLVRKKGRIHITSEPSGATIYIDDKPEMDNQGEVKRTPNDLYKIFGEYELKLKFEKYEDSTQTLMINKSKLNPKHVILKPKPGRLMLRVPSDHKDADVYVDGNLIGSMDGVVVQTFEVRANVSQIVQVIDGNFESKIESFEVAPDGHKKLEIDEFSDLRKEKEERDKQYRLEAERRKNERVAKIKKQFKDTRLEIRTFGHMVNAQAYSLYFYFEPRFGVGYVTGKHYRESAEINNESVVTYNYTTGGYEDTCDYDCESSILKYRTDLSAIVLRYRIPADFLTYGDGYLSSLRYLDSALGISLFGGTGKVISQSTGRNSKVSPSGWTIDYVWYAKNGISILFGLGFINYNPEEDWIRNYEDFAGPTDWSWGLFNIGYMF